MRTGVVRIACLGTALAGAPALGADVSASEARARFAEARELERSGHCEEAIQVYATGAERGYPESQVLARIGSCHKLVAERAGTPAAERLDRRLRAAQALARAIRLDPRNTSALGTLADLALNAGDARGALALYRHMDAIAPETPTTLARLASTHARLGDHELALALFRRAVARLAEAEPGDLGGRGSQRDVAAFSHLGAAQSLIALDRRTEARHELARVLELAAEVDSASAGGELERSSARARMLLGALDADPPAASEPPLR